MINKIGHTNGSSFSKDVLIVEDDFLMTILLEQYLRRMGNYVVRTANNGKDAIKLNKNCNPEVIIISSRLRGGLDGVQTTARIRSSSNTPVIYIGDEKEGKVEERLSNMPYVRFLTDPVTVDGLEEVFDILFTRNLAVSPQRADRIRRAAV